MTSRERLKDDAARIAGEAVGAAQGLISGIKTAGRTKMHDIAHDLDLVPREDFEALKAVVETLEARIKTLEDKT